MTASVEVLTSRKQNVLSVPLAAVTTRNPDEKPATGGPGPDGGNNNNNNNSNRAEDANKKAPVKKDKIVVFVNDKGKAKMVEVKTGISDYDNIEILSGLNNDQEVVTGPFLAVSKRLKDGDAIKQMKKEEKKKREKC